MENPSFVGFTVQVHRWDISSVLAQGLRRWIGPPDVTEGRNRMKKSMLMALHWQKSSIQSSYVTLEYTGMGRKCIKNNHHGKRATIKARRMEPWDLNICLFTFTVVFHFLFLWGFLWCRLMNYSVYNLSEEVFIPTYYSQ